MATYDNVDDAGKTPVKCRKVVRNFRNADAKVVQWYHWQDLAEQRMPWYRLLGIGLGLSRPIARDN
jgi:hypothetical protein